MKVSLFSVALAVLGNFHSVGVCLLQSHWIAMKLRQVSRTTNNVIEKSLEMAFTGEKVSIRVTKKFLLPLKNRAKTQRLFGTEIIIFYSFLCEL